MRTAAEIAEANKLRYQAKTEHLLQKETWGMLSVCSSAMAVIAATTTDETTRQQASECLSELTEMALALDSKQSNAFAEENALYLSKTK